MAWPNRGAAVCEMRLAPHDVQNPRRFQLNASGMW